MSDKLQFVAVLESTLNKHRQAEACRTLKRASPSGQGAGLQIRYREFESHRALQNPVRATCGSGSLVADNPTLSTQKINRPLPQAVLIERRCRVMALNGRVLLLNQTYEPLGTVSVARAIIMTFKNTVFVEEFDGDRVLRSAHDEFPVPSVIRRRTYINVRRRR